MDRKLKQALSAAFDVPAPVRKADFLKQHRRRELSCWELLTLQIRYIQGWVWYGSLALFLFVLIEPTWSAEPALWHAAAVTPFLAALIITENGRSQSYRMEELELACRISRQSVLLTRMVVLGLFHLILLGALTPALAAWGTIGLLRAGLYLLTPYLLAAVSGMELTRHFRGREGLLACGVSAALVSMLGTAIPALYQPKCLPLWMAVLAAAVIAAGIEFALHIKGMGELQWS